MKCNTECASLSCSCKHIGMYMSIKTTVHFYTVIKSNICVKNFLENNLNSSWSLKLTYNTLIIFLFEKIKISIKHTDGILNTVENHEKKLPKDMSSLRHTCQRRRKHIGDESASVVLSRSLFIFYKIVDSLVVVSPTYSSGHSFPHTNY